MKRPAKGNAEIAFAKVIVNKKKQTELKVNS